MAFRPEQFYTLGLLLAGGTLAAAVFWHTTLPRAWPILAHHRSGHILQLIYRFS